jgi:hypothetical protein
MERAAQAARFHVRSKPPGVPGATDGRLIAPNLQNDKEIKPLKRKAPKPDYACQINASRP